MFLEKGLKVWIYFDLNCNTKQSYCDYSLKYNKILLKFVFTVTSDKFNAFLFYLSVHFLAHFIYPFTFSFFLVSECITAHRQLLR